MVLIVAFADRVQIRNIGDLILWRNEEIDRQSLNAPADTRLLVDEMGRILVLTDATTRYL